MDPMSDLITVRKRVESFGRKRQRCLFSTYFNVELGVIQRSVIRHFGGNRYCLLLSSGKIKFYSHNKVKCGNNSISPLLISTIKSIH